MPDNHPPQFLVDCGLVALSAELCNLADNADNAAKAAGFGYATLNDGQVLYSTYLNSINNMEKYNG